MIKNLKVGLPEHGKIKAGTKGEEVVSGGGKKFRLPKKLDHFIITTTERDEEGNLILDTDLMDALKKSDNAIVDKEGNLTGIPIRLLYNSIDLNFQTRYACYVGGKCVCFGNGETARTRDGRDKKCPCKQLDFDYTGKDKCKANGRLICLIDGASIVGACHILRTTSINTVKSILGSLAFIQTAASGMLAFLPLHLILKPKSVTIPSGASSTVYVSSIVYRGSIEQLRTQSLTMAKEKAQFLIKMDTVEESARELMAQEVESEQEQIEVQEEFYPDAVEAEVIPPAEQEPEAKPEPKPAPKPKPSAKQEPPAKQKPDPKLEKEPEPEKVEEPEPPAEQTPITKDQKRQIVSLKKENKITDPAVWAKLLEPFEVKTANDLTETSANEFIEALQKNPF